MTSDVMYAISQLADQPLPEGCRHDPAVDVGTITALGRGELVSIDERIVVSPATGVFTPLTVEGTHVEVGERIGQVCTRSAVIPVCTPFTGQLVALDAWEGERVDRCQRVAWLRQSD